MYSALCGVHSSFGQLSRLIVPFAPQAMASWVAALVCAKHCMPPVSTLFHVYMYYNACIHIIRKTSALRVEYGVCGDLIIIYPKPYSIYLRGTICHLCHIAKLPSFRAPALIADPPPPCRIVCKAHDPLQLPNHKPCRTHEGAEILHRFLYTAQR